LWFDPDLAKFFYYFDTPALERRYQSFGRVKNLGVDSSNDYYTPVDLSNDYYTPELGLVNEYNTQVQFDT
jgi:hypothetical protein